MKKQFTLIVLAIFALVRVSTAQSALIIHDKQINKFAAAAWEFTSSDQCVVTDIVVQSGETKQTVNGGGQPFSSTFTYILITQIDFCRLQYDYYGEAVLWGGDDNVANDLTSGMADVTLPVTDLVSGTTSSVHIALNWTSNSPMITGQFSNSHINLKGLHYAVNDHGIYRNADITGSITIDGGSNIVDNNPALCYIIRGGPSDIINIHPRMANPDAGNVIANSNVSVYPNPASDMVHFDAANVTRYSIVNMLGAVVMGNNVEGKTSEDIDLSNVAPGIYFLNLQTEQGLVVKKFIKE